MLENFQKKVKSTAIVCVSIWVIFAFIVSVFFALGKFVDSFASVIYPVVLATCSFILLKPVADFFKCKLRMSKEWAAISIFISLLLLFVLIFIFVAPALIAQISAFVAEFPKILKSTLSCTLDKFPNIKDAVIANIGDLSNAAFEKEAMQKIILNLSKAVQALAKATGSVVGICSFIAAFAVVPIYLFYMLVSQRNLSKDFDENMKWLSPTLQSDIKFLVSQFAQILVAFFRGQVVIAIIMGFLYGIGFTLCGIKFGFVIGLFAGLMNIVPYLGTISGLLAVLPTAFFQNNGGITLSLMALGVFVVVQCIEGYYLTPKIMKEKTGLHPAVIIFSIFFWGVALNGLIGMILAIPLSAFIVVFWRLLLDKLMSAKKA